MIMTEKLRIDLDLSNGNGLKMSFKKESKRMSLKQSLELASK